MIWNASERRKFVRVTFSCEVSVRTFQNLIFPTYTEDISASGLRIAISEALKPNTLITLTIYGIKKEPLICQGRIIWVGVRKNDSLQRRLLFDTGIEFQQILSEDFEKLKEFISSIAHNKTNS